jgi:predicted Zn-dependent protease
MNRRTYIKTTGTTLGAAITSTLLTTSTDKRTLTIHIYTHEKTYPNNTKYIKQYIKKFYSDILENYTIQVTIQEPVKLPPTALESTYHAITEWKHSPHTEYTRHQTDPNNNTDITILLFSKDETNWTDYIGRAITGTPYAVSHGAKLIQEIPYYTNLILHETGHCLGLKHPHSTQYPDNTHSLMHPYINNTITQYSTTSKKKIQDI